MSRLPECSCYGRAVVDYSAIATGCKRVCVLESGIWRGRGILSVGLVGLAVCEVTNLHAFL